MFAIASLFAIVGGFLDAYSYLARGHVFANAQTGNVVLFGVRAAAGNWTSAWKTLPSILAYMCGVAVARLLRVRPQKQTFRATLICQALELLVLLVLLFFGRFVPDFCAVPLIAFSAALQNTSFSNMGPWQFNSAMTTSNLRNAVSGWVQLALGETDPKLRGEAIIGSTILLCFAAGALLGGVCTLRLPAYPLLPGVVLAAAGTLLTLRERRRRSTKTGHHKQYDGWQEPTCVFAAQRASLSNSVRYFGASSITFLMNDACCTSSRLGGAVVPVAAVVPTSLNNSSCPVGEQIHSILTGFDEVL